LRTCPDYLQIDDEKRKQFFTNWNQDLLTAVRRIKND
jgi:hypothetical protein